MIDRPQASSYSRRRARGLLVALASLAMAAAALSPPRAQQSLVQPLRSRAQALFEEKQFVDAVAVFAQVADNSAATAQDFVNLALARYESNDDAGAIEALERAVERDAAHPGVFYLRGLVYRRVGDPESARDALRRALELDPTDPAIRYNLGATLESLGDTAGAKAQYEGVIEAGFDIGLQHYVSSLYRAGFMLLRERKQEEARPYLDRYQQYSRLQSQAQRAPSALEVGRHKRVVVPRVNLVSADPDSAVAMRFRRRDLELDGGAVLVADLLGGPSAAVQLGSGGVVIGNGGSRRPFTSAVGPAALGDYDRDGHPDLYVATAAGGRLYRNVLNEAAEEAFVPVSVEGLAATAAATGVHWVDADHDGDLDVLVTDRGGESAVHLLSNRGGGEFLEVTGEAGLDGTGTALDLAWGDFDSDQDVDLYVVLESGANALYSNARGGRFERLGDTVGAAGPAGSMAVVAEDFNNDGALDIAIAGDSGVTLLRNHGDGTFRRGVAVGAVSAALRLEAADLNNDGFLDLVVETPSGVQLLINAGGDVFRALGEGVPGAELLAAVDANADGAVDLLLRDAAGAFWHQQTAPVGSWLELSLDGVKNNLRGLGATVEVKSGGLYLLRPLRARRLHVGLGSRERADVVRVSWPNGIIQNELEVDTGQLLGPVAEVERLEGSCPLLYTWNGSQWQFINDVLGVAPLGMPLAAGVVHAADYDEYVPVAGESLRPFDGAYEVRFSEELRETGYIDAVRLLAVDHPLGTEVYPDEKFVAPPHPDFRLFVVRDKKNVVATDLAGNDWTEQLAAVDRDWAKPFEPYLYDGLATPHGLELRLGDVGPTDPVHLFLTGWVYWATGSSNVVVDQDPRVSFDPVSLQVPDGHGGWRTAIEDIGLPNAKNSTLVVDVSEHLDRHDPRVRVVTTLRLYWDAAFYTSGGGLEDGVVPTGDWQQEWGVPRAGTMTLRTLGGEPTSVQLPEIHVLAPQSAELQFRGFSRLQRTADGFETFDYAAPSSVSNWDQHRGSYTRYGAVDELLESADDRFVIVGTGDEVTVRFGARLPPLRSGWRRDWLVYFNGWVKDGDPNTLHGDRVEPLPFHAMSSYPYRLDERYPDTPEHRDYRRRYNIRPARRINAPLTAARR